MEATKTNNIVLLATDFSEVAEYALDHALGIAKFLGYSICIVHIINKKKSPLTIEEINLKLQTLVDDVKNKHGVEAFYIAREGSIFTTIAEIAKELGAKYLTMGTRGKTGVQYVFGSYALKVITSSPVPVFVVQKSRFNNGYKNIVLPIDHSSESKQKVKWAIQIAREFSSKIHIFVKGSSDEFVNRRVTSNVAQVKKIFEQNNIDFVDKVADDRGENFVKQIMKYAVSINADLVIILTNTGNFLPGFIIEPEDEQMVFNDSQIPIMCINPKELNKIIGGL